MNKTQIAGGMFIAMIVNLIFVKAIGITQGTIARMVGQDMWIATLLGMLQGMAIIYVTYLVIRRTPDRNFIGVGEALLGKWFARIVALTIMLFFVAGMGPIMVTFVYHLKDYFLPDAPLLLFVVAALIASILGCYYGLEVIARSALIGFLFIFLLNVLIVVGSTKEFDIRNLLPVLEFGFPKTALASVHFDADCALATMMAALILPRVKKAGRVGGKLGMAGIAISGFMIVIWSILEGAVLSAEVSSQYTVACMKLARNAHIGNFLQRYEMLMIACYSIPLLFGIMFTLYAVSLTMSNALGIRSYKKTILPSSVVIGVFGYWIVDDHFRAKEYVEHYWPWIALAVAGGLPVLMLLLRLALGKRLDKRSAGSGSAAVDPPVSPQA